MEDLEYIKKFQKITLKGLCERKKIDRSNLIKGRTTRKNIRIIREEIESEIAKLYIKNEDIENE